MPRACSYCDRVMDPGTPCTLERYDNENKDRIPNGDSQCHDCNAPANGLHHPGCDDEKCPLCRGQAIGCPCSEG